MFYFFNFKKGSEFNFSQILFAEVRKMFEVHKVLFFFFSFLCVGENNENFEFKPCFEFYKQLITCEYIFVFKNNMRHGNYVFVKTTVFRPNLLQLTFRTKKEFATLPPKFRYFFFYQLFLGLTLRKLCG